jgi:hypothetical protein
VRGAHAQHGGSYRGWRAGAACAESGACERGDADVEDDEEDDEWRAWGESRRTPVEEEPMPELELNGGPIDVSKLMKRQASGPQLAFARLRPDPTGQRTQVAGRLAV